jgi:tetratricopeptide (TPR) repeat protein
MDIAIQEKRMSDAIGELERLVQLNPENRMLLMQLASMYQMDDRPRKAMRIAERLIQAEPTDWQALRLRGDVLLALGRHADAIGDYEEAIKNIPEDEDDLSGVLNNLSWVLATSPEDSVRNGDRALEAGLRACELTEYKKSHILSTLAAAYAELGQFDKAVEWSTKAVELGGQEENEQLDQLKEELKGYESKKPWREKKETEEKQAKLREYIGAVMKNYPNLSREERGNLIRGAMMRLTDGRDIEVPQAPPAGQAPANQTNGSSQAPQGKQGDRSEERPQNREGGGGGERRERGDRR